MNLKYKYSPMACEGYRTTSPNSNNVIKTVLYYVENDSVISQSPCNYMQAVCITYKNPL